MKKDEFLKSLEGKLELLEKTQKEAILKDYKDKISKRIKNKEKEEDVIASFGDLDLMAKRILRENNVKEIVEADRKESGNYFDDFFKVLRLVVKEFTKKDYKSILKIVGLTLFIVILVILFKLPFILTRDLILLVMDTVGIGYASTQASSVRLLIDVAYLVFAIFMFINMFKKRFKNLGEKENDSKAEFKNK